MDFLDTNVFLRFITTPLTPNDVAMQDAAERLFNDVRDHGRQVTTSHTVLHEVFYLLCSRQYGLNHAEAVDKVRGLTSLRTFRLANRFIVEEAMRLFETYSFLDFSDALSVAECQAGGHQLYSFDSDFDHVPGFGRSIP